MTTFQGRRGARRVGADLGHSEWTTVTQEQVNTFADATGDHQWIHVDVERAKAESPFGGPIAHGYLTLSLTNLFLPSAGAGGLAPAWRPGWPWGWGWWTARAWA
jgi:acyl dehydratase